MKLYLGIDPSDDALSMFLDYEDGRVAYIGVYEDSNLEPPFIENVFNKADTLLTDDMDSEILALLPTFTLLGER